MSILLTKGNVEDVFKVLDNHNINSALMLDNKLKALEIIKGKIIWVENDKLMCGRYADTEIELEEEDFENKEEFDLLKEVLE